MCSLGLVSTTLHFDSLWFSVVILLQTEISLMWGEDYAICVYKDKYLQFVVGYYAGLVVIVDYPPDDHDCCSTESLARFPGLNMVSFLFSRS